jgi:hypothetical protein
MIVIFIFFIILFYFLNSQENMASLGDINDYKFKVEYITCLKKHGDCNKCKSDRVEDLVFIEQAKEMFCKDQEDKDIDIKLIKCIKNNNCSDCKKLLSYFDDKIKGNKLYDLYCNVEKFKSNINLSNDQIEDVFNKYKKDRNEKNRQKNNELNYLYCLKNKGCYRDCDEFKYSLSKKYYDEIKSKYCDKTKFRSSENEIASFKKRQIKLKT